MNKRRYLAVIVILAAVILLSSSFNTVFANRLEGDATGYLVKLRNLTDTDMRNIEAAHILIKHQYKHINAIAVEANEIQVDKLLRNPNVIFVEIDGEFHALDEYDLSWGVTQIGSKVLHDQGIKGQAVKVAVIDTGVDYTHSELADVYRGGYDFVNEDADPMDDHYHGTHCAGILAAALDGVGIVGVAPEVELYALKILDSTGSGSFSDAIAAIDWCIDNDIQITTNSYGSSGYSLAVQEAFDQAYEAGILSFAAAGNSGGGETKDTTVYPARINSVVGVAATDKADTKASFSSTGPATEISAPGVDIFSCFPGGYGTKSGTSMACPHVAGVAALMKSAHSDWTNELMRNQLHATATDLGPTGLDWLYGFGLVNAIEACDELISNPPTMPPVPPPITMVTYSPSEIGSTYAVLEGECMSMGGKESLEVTFAYGPYTPPVTGLKPSPYETITSPCKFSYRATGLSPGTEYLYMACANRVGGNFIMGNRVFFTTKESSPSPPPPPPPPPSSVYVTRIDFRSAGPNVKVNVMLSEPVSDARVSLLFQYGIKSESAVSYTSDGVASFQFHKIPNGLCQATVTGISNYEWDKDKGIISETYTHYKKGKRS